MFNRLVFWIAIGFLIYVMASQQFAANRAPQTTPPANTPASTTPAQTPPAKTSILTNALDNIIRPATEGKLPLTVDAGGRIPTELQNINDTTPGTGHVAVCGSHVHVNYALHGEPLSATDADFVVGERSVFPGLEAAVLGMREKGIRRADLPPALAYNNMALANNPYSTQLIPLEVGLLSASPDVSYPSHAVQVFDKKPGTGNAAKCFDTVYIHYTVRTLEGKLLADTEAKKLSPLSLVIGKGFAPLGVEQALVGMKEDSTRTALIFPEAMIRLQKEGQVMLEGEADYPKAGLIFEFKRLPNP